MRSTASVWLYLAACAPLTTLLFFGQRHQLLEGALLASSLILPVAVVDALGAERGHRGLLMLTQLGHSTRAVFAVHALVACGIAVISLLPPALALLLSPARAELDLRWAACAGAGVLLYAAFCIGAAALCAGIAQQTGHARVLVLGLLGALLVIDHVGLPWARFLPLASARVLTLGVFDVRGACALLLGTLACVGMGAAWSAPQSPRERRALALAAVAATALVCTALASQISTSWDLTRDARHSVSPAAAHALGQIHESVHVSTPWMARDPRQRALEERVLVPLSRAVSVRVTRDPGLQDGIVLWRVGTRSRALNAHDLKDVVPVLAELAGVPVPLLVAAPEPPRLASLGSTRSALCLGWPALVVLLAWMSRPRAPAQTLGAFSADDAPA